MWWAALTSVIIGHTGQSSPLLVDVIGESVRSLSSRVDAEPRVVNFGSFGRTLRPLSDRNTDITITNTGEVEVQIGEIVLKSADGISPAGSTVLTHNCHERQLAPDQACTIRLVFTARSVDAFADTLIISHDASSPQIQIPVTGQVEDPVQ